jgi:hypothetical protein
LTLCKKKQEEYEPQHLYKDPGRERERKKGKQRGEKEGGEILERGTQFFFPVCSLSPSPRPKLKSQIYMYPAIL